MYGTLSEEPTAPSENSRTSKLLLNRIEPLSDPRWERFVNAHPRASVFHSRAWLEALHRTYGYEPVAFTTTSAGKELQNGAVFCRVESRLTGRRLVSLPFSDHCELLVDDEKEMHALVDGLKRELRERAWGYIEVRPLRHLEFRGSFGRPNATYMFHELDLRPELETLLANCHKSSIQRKIQRAAREGLEYKEGSNESLLNSFYRLLVLTRRRHYLPPQPKSWFRNLMHCFGDALKIRITLKDGKPVAGMLTLRHKDTLIYKYGGSDLRFHKLGAMHLLYWESIRDAKNCGLRKFDLGRTDAHQSGLIRFKSRWGAPEATLTYWRYAETGRSNHAFDQSETSWRMRLLKHALACTPPVALPMLGSLLYKHAG
jgi:lipid II:glycine glycyltransferase (peptidoglycan interpeptide bridge formation enzyme)